MDTTLIIPFLAVPIAMFFGGLMISKQFRTMQNVPLFAKLYVEKRWLLSIITGGVISILFTFILSISQTFSMQFLILVVGMFLLATFSYYFGVTLGWGHTLSTDEKDTPVNQVDNNILPENIILDEQPASLRITINSQKRWGMFILSLFQWIFIGLCALPIIGLVSISILQKYLPTYLNIPIWIIVAGLALYLIYTKFQGALEYIFDKEIIEIDNQSVTIEKYGSSFKSRKEYPADNIKKITALFSFAGTNMVIRRSPFVNPNMPAFMMWHERGLKRFRSFGRSVDLADAQNILETIYSKFPQYKG